MPVATVRALKGRDDEYLLDCETLAALWNEIRNLKDMYHLNIDIPGDKNETIYGCAWGAPCMAGFSHIVIDPSLRVRPCDRCVETYVGDLRTQTIAQIWQDNSIQQVLQSTIPYCQREDPSVYLHKLV